MDRPVIFLSAVSAEFRELRQLLHDSFKTHFHVITQDDTLHKFPGGDIRQLLSDAIDGSHAVLHLAGAGFGSTAVGSGSTAAAPFPEMPGFLCSWTQYEYYYAHSFDADPVRRKQIFAIVCGPSLRSPSFTEKDDATLTAAQKAPLQEAHCQRIFSGKFDATPLASLPRTINDNAAAPALIGGGIILLRQGQMKQDIVQNEPAAFEALGRRRGRNKESRHSCRERSSGSPADTQRSRYPAAHENLWKCRMPSKRSAGFSRLALDCATHWPSRLKSALHFAAQNSQIMTCASIAIHTSESVWQIASVNLDDCVAGA
jgi:hypothetical protein